MQNSKEYKERAIQRLSKVAKAPARRNVGEAIADFNI